MGTRNMSGVFIDGTWKVAKYSQWDGYPSGVGTDILEVFSNVNLVTLKEKIKNNAKFANDEFVKEAYTNLGIELNEGWINMDDSNRFKNRYPLLDRDTTLKDVAMAHLSNSNDNPIFTKNDVDFAKDSLFCEYAYVVDFDKNTFEVYRGFNSEQLDESERFFGTDSLEEHPNGNTYYPVRFWHSWTLDALPTKEEFIKTLSENDEDEDEEVA